MNDTYYTLCVYMTGKVSGLQLQLLSQNERLLRLMGSIVWLIDSCHFP